MLLNVGCGEFYVDGWVNIDTHRGGPVQPDFVCSALGLIWDDGTFDRVYLGHVLEHITWDDVPRALAEVRRVLKPEGRMAATGPNDGRDGAGRWPGDEHQWECTASRMLEVIQTVFPDAVLVERLPDEWPVVAHVDWQCSVLA